MIRRSTADDHRWIERLAAEVYGALGDYGRIIGTWLDHPGVLAYVDETPIGELRGFAMLGFYEPQESSNGVDYVADLLAIAVAPSFQRMGVGRELLRYTIHVARLAGKHNRVSEIRLTVAHDNAVGRNLYLSSGFVVLDEDHGLYDGGQRAIRMARPLP